MSVLLVIISNFHLFRLDSIPCNIPAKTIEMGMEQGRTSAVKEETEHELSRLPALDMIPAVESIKDILLFKYWFIHPSRYNQS